jgi:23S rRNA (guanine745-N1)-methyltransferase
MSAVPPALIDLAPALRCPHCGAALAAADGALACAGGHRFDVARQGYVSLLSGPTGREAGDDAAMIAARDQIERAGHWRPLSDALAAAVPTVTRLLDVGAGTGAHAAALLGRFPEARGVAVDVSAFASRRAARAHPGLAAVRADVWSQIPLRDGAADVALDVFSPRNGRELARVIAPAGTLVVATPDDEHLAQLREFHTLSIHPGKDTELHQRLGEWFDGVSEQPVGWTMSLTAGEAAAVLAMGPSARHLRRGALKRLRDRSEALEVTAAVRVWTFRRRPEA